MERQEPNRPVIAVTHRIRRVLEPMGIVGELLLSHVDGKPLSSAEVAACVRAIAELDAAEFRDDRGPPRR